MDAATKEAKAHDQNQRRNREERKKRRQQRNRTADANLFKEMHRYTGIMRSLVRRDEQGHSPRVTAKEIYENEDGRFDGLAARDSRGDWEDEDRCPTAAYYAFHEAERKRKEAERQHRVEMERRKQQYLEKRSFARMEYIRQKSNEEVQRALKEQYQRQQRQLNRQRHPESDDEESSRQHRGRSRSMSPEMKEEEPQRKVPPGPLAKRALEPPLSKQKQPEPEQKQPPRHHQQHTQAVVADAVKTALSTVSSGNIRSPIFSSAMTGRDAQNIGPDDPKWMWTYGTDYEIMQRLASELKPFPTRTPGAEPRPPKSYKIDVDSTM